MSAMTEMSRAIRLTMQRYADTLGELPDDVLADFAEIIYAFNADLRDELRRRAAA